MVTKVQPEEVTEARFYEMLEVLPPIYLNTIDGQRTKGLAFAVSEAYSHCPAGVVLRLFWKHDGKFLSCFGAIQHKNGQPVFETYRHTFSHLHARTVHQLTHLPYTTTIPEE
ncbi:MAG: hypothetical protein EOP50_00130 [Sphingobacteriales bacterium]|nr:MAG: hypothetical protein EOP50_00130 [Sphingobacteriales bacterium]